MSPIPRPLSLLIALAAVVLSTGRASTVWIEGEESFSTNIRPHPWYAKQTKQELLSRGGMLAHFNAAAAGVAEYRFSVPATGTYTFWARVNPVKASLHYSLNGGPEVPVLFSQAQAPVNIAADGKRDLRFIAWVEVGKVELKSGENRMVFTMDSADHNHGAIDCLVFTDESFVPDGIAKPGQSAAATSVTASGWFAWNPPADDFHSSPIDLRPLNERFAGEQGRIVARGEEFVHERTGLPVRFWAVNGPSGSATEDLPRSARLLAKYGVNLVRYHAAPFDAKSGDLTADGAGQRARIVDAMKAEGIYTHLSIYFPLWLKPESGDGWREGYDGAKRPFALLYFEPGFQRMYRDWWRAVLTAKTPSGVSLVDEPALMGIELVNEDSLFFWTFSYKNVPEPQMRKMEARFGEWAARRYGSMNAALEKWTPVRHDRDDPASGRLGFRDFYTITHARTLRDQDTVAFLYEQQHDFYSETVDYIRGLGYKGLITASNWTTANNALLGPLERFSYLPGDFIDHHGYVSCNHKGDNAAWSIRNGHTYSDVSALRFDNPVPGRPRLVANPAMDPMYDSRPSMISEIAWNRPNRHRAEAPLFLASYASLQGTDAIVNFAFDGGAWSVKPRHFMQPWTLMSPSQMGQFPAAAFIYRQGLLRTGELMADVPLSLGQAVSLQGVPLVQQASLDELRKADANGEATPDQADTIDPLIHFVGRTNVRLVETSGVADVKDLSAYVDHRAQTVFASTRELCLDYGRGVLSLNAPSVQGMIGDLAKMTESAFPDVEIESGLEVGEIVVVALDGRPLASSSRILVQAMSEDRPTGFETAPVSAGVNRIVSIGRDPWLVREINGRVALRRADASRLRVTALDLAGYPDGDAGRADGFELRPGTAYYLITP